ncbi:MAG: hypothetical protein ACRDJM_02745 [Actinomycetota bacterium]
MSTPTVLTNADKGTGTFDASSLLSCVGSVLGTGTLSGTGDFAFCRHNYTGANPNAACHTAASNGANQLDQTMDPVYDNINGITGQGLSAHFRGGPETATGFQNGGACTFTFEGHAITAQALISMNSFQCTGRDVAGNVIPRMTGVATASSVFEVFQCGAELCFQRVQFFGTIELSVV